jgi:hypothetical protein
MFPGERAKSDAAVLTRAVGTDADDPIATRAEIMGDGYA